MTEATRLYSRPPTNTSAIDAPPRPPTSQERGDNLLMRWRLERAAGIPADRRLTMTAERTAREILADFLEEEMLVPNPEALAALILEKLHDAGFEVVVTTEDQA